MSKQFWGVIILVVLIFAGIFWISGNKKADAPQNGSSSKTLTEHVEGKGKSGVTLVEYGDYQCPYCGQYYPVVKQIQAKFNDQIYFQFRNYPIVNIHRNAFAAARAAEAAAMQGKFWQMHDALYESQAQWESSNNAYNFFAQLAKKLGLDTAKFKSDYASGKVNDLINADEAEGNRLKVSGTPTFFLNGKKIDVTQDPASFEKLINAAIASKSTAN